MAVTYEKAAEAGMRGRILWALQELGRGPHPNRVYQKANERMPRDKRDDTKIFTQELNALLKEGLISFNSDTERITLTVPVTGFRLKCSAFNCPERGPEAPTPEEATQKAREAGWVVSDASKCPTHAKGTDKPESRLERRRRLHKQQKEQRAGSRLAVSRDVPERTEIL